MSVLWGYVYGPLVHYALGKAIAQLFFQLCVLLHLSRGFYLKSSLALTDLAGLLAVIILWPQAKRDRYLRDATGITQKPPHRPLYEYLVLLFMGASLSYYGNVLLSLMIPMLPQSDYFNEMDMLTSGKTFGILLLLVGLLAPIAEEFVFREMLFLRLRDHHGYLLSALLSGLAFGLYHGNPYQALYAGLLGFFFSLGVEFVGSLWGGILLHMGANIFSLTLTEYAYQLLLPPLDKYLLLFVIAMSLISVLGWSRLLRAYINRKGIRYR